MAQSAKSQEAVLRLHYSICHCSIGPLSSLSALSQRGGLLEGCQCLAADSFLGHELGGKSADYISAQIADTAVLESCSRLLDHLFFSLPYKGKIRYEVKFNPRSRSVTLRFYHLETSEQNLIFCSLCMSDYPAAAESCKYFLGIKYSMKLLHKLLKQFWWWKRQGWVEPNKLNKRKILRFAGHSWATIGTLVSWLAQRRRYTPNYMFRGGKAISPSVAGVQCVHSPFREGWAKFPDRK